MTTGSPDAAMQHGNGATHSYFLLAKRYFRNLLLPVGVPRSKPCPTPAAATWGIRTEAEEDIPSRQPCLVAETYTRPERVELVGTSANVDRGYARHKTVEAAHATAHAQVKPLPGPDILQPSRPAPGVASIRGGSGPSHSHMAQYSLASQAAQLVSQPHDTMTQFPQLSVVQANTAIQQAILKNTSSRTRSSEGWIYAFTGPVWHGDAQPVKIGQTGDTVAGRLKDIARQCHYEPQCLFAYPVPNPARYETLVHATLHNYRRREASGCTGCHKKHQEWFLVADTAARRVVRMWAFFAAQGPYDEGTGELKDEWRARLASDEVDLDDPLCWDTFVYGRAVDDFIAAEGRVRVARKAVATCGILEAGAVPRMVAGSDGE